LILPAHDDRLAPPPGRAPGGSARHDRLLVERCLAGDDDAWEQVYRQCHPRLLGFIDGMLRRRGAPADLRDDLAARVWHLVLADDGARLARFRADRGCRLSTFLSAIASKEILRHLRSEVRQRHRDGQSVRPAAEPDQASPWSVWAQLREFMGTLSPRERAYCEDCLLAEPSSDAAAQFSDTNAWQLRHRVRRKLQNYLGVE
jgi:DNA-directed RNA polymerase specialized sigma24 family protein